MKLIKAFMEQIQNITSDRLFGEAMNSSHLPLWIEMGASKLLTAAIGGTWDEKKALEKLNYNIDHWKSYGYGQ
jgi:hypothetical protein